ncbi:Prostaglandin reductase 1, partial [Galemys pyrenaicus]
MKHLKATKLIIPLKTVELPTLEIGKALPEALLLTPYMRVAVKILKEDKKMMGQQVARVLESKNSALPTGTTAVISFRLDKDDSGQIIYHCLWLWENLGFTGLTTYLGLFDICGIKGGKTVMINAAEEATAKIKGYKVGEQQCLIKRLPILKNSDLMLPYTVGNMEELLDVGPPLHRVKLSHFPQARTRRSLSISNYTYKRLLSPSGTE